MAVDPTSTPRVTHVSLIAEDIEESAAFYEEVLGCERLPTPRFDTQEDFKSDESANILIMRLGDVQLHLWNDPGQDIEVLQLAHTGIHVDDFEGVYREVEKRDAFATIGEATAPPQVFDFNGTAQMYIRDPTGNLLEIDYPDIDELDHSVFAKVVRRETSGPNTGTYTDEVLAAIGKRRRAEQAE